MTEPERARPDHSATDRFAGRPLRWGMLGAGHIAGVLADAIASTGGNTVHAVAARDGDRARSFAAHHRVSAAYEGYQDLLQDPDVDVVYLSTTHPWHREQALMSIAAGKALLIEKPLTLNADQAREVLSAAREAGAFAMEAMWMRCNPLVRQALDLVAEQAIGEIVHVQARLCARFELDPAHRLFDPENGGGSLLDLGVYPATFAWMFLGAPRTVQITGSLAPTGVDGTVALQLGYAGGATAQVFCSSATQGPGTATVLGTAGWLQLGEPYQNPTELVVQRGEEQERISAEPAGYVPEVLEVERCVRAGLLQSPLVPHEDTVGILQVLDAARRELGVSYPQEVAG